MRMSERGTLASVLGYVFIGSPSGGELQSVGYNSLKATNKENQVLQVQRT